MLSIIFNKLRVFTKKELVSPLKFSLLVGNNDIATVTDLLSRGFDPNQVITGTGERPLHTAAAWAGIEMIDCLLNAGAEPLVGIRVATLKPMSPAGFAMLMKQPENFEYLRRIEDERRRILVAAGAEVPILSQEPVPLGFYRQCLLPRTSSRKARSPA